MPVPLDYRPNPAVRLPPAILVFAWLYLAAGAAAAFNVGWGISRDELRLDLTVLGVFVGRGLLLRLEAARRIAVAVSWLGMISAALFAALCLWDPAKLQFRVSEEALDVPIWTALLFGLSLGAGLFLLSFWQHRVMTRRATRALFLDSTSGENQQQRNRLWRLWVWAIATLAILIAGYGAQRYQRSSGGWGTVSMPRTLRDWRGNGGCADESRNAVGIAATGQNRFSLGFLIGPNRLVVDGGGPSQQYVVPLKANRLCIVLPDGSRGEFRVPKGFARKVAAGGSGNADLSLLREAVKRMDDPREKAKLERFLANFNEPPSWLTLQTTRPASSRPSTQASQTP